MNVCWAPTKRYPEGRTGTDAGYQAHRTAGQPACGDCQSAHIIKCRTAWSELTDVEREAIRAANRIATSSYRKVDPARARAV